MRRGLDLVGGEVKPLGNRLIVGPLNALPNAMPIVNHARIR